MKQVPWIFSLLLFVLFAQALNAVNASSAFAMDVEFEKDRSVPIVNVNVLVKTGSIEDPTDLQGLTFFTAQAMLRGTLSRTKEQIDLALDQIGAKLAVEVRAEMLIFRGAVLSAHLTPYLELLEEILTAPRFSEDELTKLRALATSGILQQLGNDGALSNRFYQQFQFQGHAYGNPVFGTMVSVGKIKTDHLKKQYDQIFRYKRFQVLASGDASEEQLEKWAKRVSDKRPGGTEPPLISPPLSSPQRRLQIVDKPDRTQTQIRGGFLGIKMNDPNYFAIQIANEAFGGGNFSARLMQEIRDKRGWSYGAFSSFTYGRQPRSWSFHLYPANKDTPAALELTLRLIQDLKQKGLTREEFDFTKTSLIRSAGFMYNTPGKRIENRLLEITLGLHKGFFQNYSKQIEKVTYEETQAAIARFMTPENLSITVLGTAKDLKAPLASAAGVPLRQVLVVPYDQEIPKNAR